MRGRAGGISCDFRIRQLARNVQISEEVNHLMLSTSNTCNCVVSSPEMASSCKGKAIVLMGVSGAGKSTIGSILGRAVHGRFLDADDYHSASNKEKMRNGIPLCDEDRVPWLKTLRDVLRIGLINNETLILACSALQKQYREIPIFLLKREETGVADVCVQCGSQVIQVDDLVRSVSSKGRSGLKFGWQGYIWDSFQTEGISALYLIVEGYI